MTDYADLERELKGLLQAETDKLANSANFVALLFQHLSDVNWAGIYVKRGEELVLGPFQGKPACVRIVLGKGVCGTAARTHKTLRVDDVHAFPGHIACDPDSRSELVVPLTLDNRLIGVLDIDSPQPARFSEADERGIERLCQIFTDKLQTSLKKADEFL